MRRLGALPRPSPMRLATGLGSTISHRPVRRCWGGPFGTWQRVRGPSHAGSTWRASPRSTQRPSPSPGSRMCVMESQCQRCRPSLPAPCAGGTTREGRRPRARPREPRRTPRPARTGPRATGCRILRLWSTLSRKGARRRPMRERAGAGLVPVGRGRRVPLKGNRPSSQGPTSRTPRLRASRWEPNLLSPTWTRGPAGCWKVRPSHHHHLSFGSSLQSGAGGLRNEDASVRQLHICPDIKCLPPHRPQVRKYCRRCPRRSCWLRGWTRQSPTLCSAWRWASPRTSHCPARHGAYAWAWTGCKRHW